MTGAAEALVTRLLQTVARLPFVQWTWARRVAVFDVIVAAVTTGIEIGLLVDGAVLTELGAQVARPGQQDGRGSVARQEASHQLGGVDAARAAVQDDDRSPGTGARVFDRTQAGVDHLAVHRFGAGRGFGCVVRHRWSFVRGQLRNATSVGRLFRGVCPRANTSP